MQIKNCVLSDTNEILSLYEAARSLQMQKKMVVWPFFDKAFIENEISQQRHWKMVVDDTIACNWVISFEDKEIWGGKEQGDSIYIHRICTNPNFRGNRCVDKIVEWAKK